MLRNVWILFRVLAVLELALIVGCADGGPAPASGPAASDPAASGGPAEPAPPGDAAPDQPADPGGLPDVTPTPKE